MTLNEDVLTDDYPMYVGYLYVADGKVIQCVQSMNVGRYKIIENHNEIRRCDIFGRRRLMEQS